MSRIRAVALLVFFVTGAHASAQGPDADSGTRFGVSIGGISRLGFVVEFFHDARSIEVGVGTWSFHDVSVSTVVKQYFGAGAAQPFVGAGLWTVAAAPGDERSGFALVLRAPIGVDWGIADDHALGVALSLNRGIAVRRSDPEDERPINKRLVPLPEIYYRLTR